MLYFDNIFLKKRYKENGWSIMVLFRGSRYKEDMGREHSSREVAELSWRLRVGSLTRQMAVPFMRSPAHTMSSNTPTGFESVVLRPIDL